MIDSYTRRERTLISFYFDGSLILLVNSIVKILMRLTGDPWLDIPTRLDIKRSTDLLV